MPVQPRARMTTPLSLLMNRRFLARHYDPYRILINQIIRLFSGSLPILVFGIKFGAKLGHSCLVIGLFMNISNAYIKFNSFWLEKKGQRLYFLPYFILTATVFIVSGSSLIRFIFGMGGLMLTTHIPTAVFSGTLQLIAEVYDLLCLRYSLRPKNYENLAHRLQNSLPAHHVAIGREKLRSPDLNDQITYTLAKQFRRDLELYRRKIVMAICLGTVTGIAWFSIFHAQAISHAAPFGPLLLTACGISFALFNFLAGKICLKSYFSPSQNLLAESYERKILKPGYNLPLLQFYIPKPDQFKSRSNTKLGTVDKTTLTRDHSTLPELQPKLENHQHIPSENTSTTRILAKKT